MFLIDFEKMYKIDPDKVLGYFSHQVSYEKAKQLGSVSIAQEICYLKIQIDDYNCQFFAIVYFYKTCRILLSVLCKRDRQKLLLIISKGTYNIMGDETIYDNIIIWN